jgi:hypothetical protein
LGELAVWLLYRRSKGSVAAFAQRSDGRCITVLGMVV